MKLRFVLFFLTISTFYFCENTQKSTVSPPAIVVFSPPIDTQTSEISVKSDVHLSSDSIKKHIYFTVDDGPSAYSRQILEMAETEQAPMTVFLVGSNCITNERAEMVNNYHNCRLVEVGNHSFCHANNDYDRWYLNPNNVLADFQKNEKQLAIRSDIARLPGRAIWQIGNRAKCIFATGKSSGIILGKNNFRVFGWDVEWHFFHKTGLPKETPEQVMESIEKHLSEHDLFTQNHVVLLLHERHFQQLKDVRKLIRLLKSAGFEFSYLGNYPKS
jgi:hypothetical protein